MSRLFVAVTPPAAVLDALGALPRSDEPDVRWTPREQWHVTLRFLGDADADEVRAALAAAPLPRAAAELGPTVGRLGRGVVCVPVQGLEELAAAVVEATAGLGRPPEDRVFRGHLTIARLGKRAVCEMTGARVSASWEVHEVELVDSTLTGAGAIHRVVSTRPL